MAKTDLKVTARKTRARRIRSKISGTSERPRLRVFRSNKHIYAQIIDDANHKTLISMSTGSKDFTAGDAKGKSELSKLVGEMIAKRALDAGIKQVVFDRGGYLYHGRVKALADGAREGGLQF